MKTDEQWKLFERLANPDLPLDERARLENGIESDPVLLERYNAFQLLSDWSQLEPMVEGDAARINLLDRFESDHERVVAEQALWRVFPAFIGGALAATVVFALLNYWQFDDPSVGAMDALFGIPSESVETIMVSQL